MFAMFRSSIWVCALVAALTVSLRASAAEVYYISEDFSSETGYFYQGTIGETAYAYHPEGGFYEIDARKSKTGSLAALTEQFSAYEASVSLEFHDSIVSDDIYAGMVFHYQEDREGRASFLLYAVFPDGYYCVWLVDRESRRQYVYRLTRTQLVNRGGQNTLRVVARGTHFELYLNGRFVGEFSHNALNRGGVGLFASAGTQARFRSFRWRVNEEEFGERSVGFRIEDEDLEDLRTVRDAVDYVHGRL